MDDCLCSYNVPKHGCRLLNCERMVKQIELTKGKFATVDDIDYPRVSQFKWTLDSNGYAVRKATIGPKSTRKILLHRFITGAPKGFDVDHKDGDPLNNTRANLRVCTRAQNSMNRGPMPGSSSQYKGVTFHKRDRVWYARLVIDGQSIHLGCFRMETEAAQAYDKAAYDQFGEFAYLNFPLYPHGDSNPGRGLERAES
jgi:hypothetical protein